MLILHMIKVSACCYVHMLLLSGSLVTGTFTQASVTRQRYVTTRSHAFMRVSHYYPIRFVGVMLPYNNNQWHQIDNFPCQLSETYGLNQRLREIFVPEHFM